MPKDEHGREYIEYEDGHRVLLDEDDVPELTEEDFARARPLKDANPALYAMLNKGGRPRKDDTAQPITIRLEPNVEATFRATGKGWQTRINHALSEWIAQHP